MKNKSIILGLSFLFSLILFLIKYTVFSLFLKDILGRQWLEITFNTLFFMPIIFFFSSSHTNSPTGYSLIGGNSLAWLYQRFFSWLF